MCCAPSDREKLFCDVSTVFRNPTYNRTFAMDSPFQFHLDAYEGPLDLLLDLIRKQQIDIYDIPIATITSQFLDAFHRMKHHDIDAGGEFVLMASTLIHIKSKMLLPAD